MYIPRTHGCPCVLSLEWWPILASSISQLHIYWLISFTTFLCWSKYRFVSTHIGFQRNYHWWQAGSWSKMQVENENSKTWFLWVDWASQKSGSFTLEGLPVISSRTWRETAKRPTHVYISVNRQDSFIANLPIECTATNTLDKGWRRTLACLLEDLSDVEVL